MEFSYTYPSYYLILCILAGLAYALVLYYGKCALGEVSRGIRILLAVLRGTLVAGLVFLLFSPVIRQHDAVSRKPILLIGQDVSSSIPQGMSGEALEQYRTRLRNLEDELGEVYDIREAGVGEKVTGSIPDTFNEKISNIGSILPYWNELYAYQPVGAAILATDGIYNAGTDPVYQPYQLQAPLYVIPLGDTMAYPDLRIDRTLYNDVVYLNDDMVIEAELMADKWEGARTRLTLERKSASGWSRVTEQSVQFPAGGMLTESFRIKADRTGINEYRLVLTPLENERILSNNYHHFFLDVIDARQRIQIFAASPHPDIAAIKQWLSDDQRFEISVSYRQDVPALDDKVDMVIFHQLPTKNYPMNDLIRQLDRRKIPRLFIAGRQTEVEQFNGVQSLVRIDGHNGQFNEAQALINTDFRQFTLNDESRQRLPQFPPLTSFFGNYQVSPAAHVFMKQRISRIETEYPLVLMGEQDGIRTGAILGEGIWRWRLYDQLQHQQDAISREWFAKTIQYLSVVQDRDPFQVTPARRIYPQTAPVVIDARLYNANYELINTPDVPLSITNEDGTAFEYYFDKNADRYTLDAGRFPPGNYQYRSAFEWDGSRYEDRGSFSVQAISIEANTLRADHRVLHQLAANNNGKLVYPDQLSAFAEELRNAPGGREVIMNTTQTFPFISLKWPFFLLLILLTAEWVIRRLYGGI